MAHTRRTLHLEPANWDITLDGSGRIALAAGDPATAQNVANEVRLFTGDAYFIQDQGIPHYLIELGLRVSPAALRSRLRQAALRVPDVREVQKTEIAGFDQATRHLSGNIEFKSAAGAESASLATYF